MWELVKSYKKEKKLNYMHWGWGGINDGWYNAGVYQTSYGTFASPQYVSVKIDN